jgi:hypothetical protein
MKCFCEKYSDENVQGIELVLKSINQHLKNCLTENIKICTLGLAEVRKEIRDNDLYTVPQIKAKNNIDYLNLEPLDESSFSFFYRKSAKRNFNQNFNGYEQDFSWVFWFNSKVVIDSEILQEIVLNSLNGKRHDVLSVLGIEFGIDGTWQDFDILKDKIARFNNKNYTTFRVDFTLSYKFVNCKCE